MAPIEPGDDRWPSRKEQLLTSVYGRSERLRRQRQLRQALAGAVAVVLIAAVPAVLAGGSGGRRAVRTIGEPPKTTAETAPETIAAPETTTTTETTTTMAPTTTTALVCRNSYSPKCGPFRWDPQPTNQPATASVTYSPANPKTGETVTFHLIASDPDAGIVSAPDPRSCGGASNAGGPTYGDWSNSGIPCVHGDPFCDRLPSGPWTAPPAKPGHAAQDYTHEYTGPGSFVADFTIISSTPGVGPCFPSDPYRSKATATVTVNVTGPPVTTTTTTPLTP